MPNVGGNDGSIPSEAYDASLQELFISDPNFNSVEVYSTTSYTFVSEILIPAPAGLSFSPDYSKLYVGTLTPYVYTVDPATLHVTGFIQIPASQLYFGVSDSTVMPVMPFAMADGSIVLGMGLYSNSGTSWISVDHLLLYQPGAGTFTSIDPRASGVSVNPARSVNGQYLAVYGLGSTGVGMELYSAATQSYMPFSAQLQVREDSLQQTRMVRSSLPFS